MFSKKILCVSLWLVLFSTIAKAAGPLPPVTYQPPKKIYLANQMGFSPLETQLLPAIANQLQNLGLEVVEPFSQNITIDFSKPGWPYQIGQRCIGDVRDCDAIFAIVNGIPPDEGVMIELGMAMAMGKEIFLFRDDIRRCSECENYPLNPMLFAGLPEKTWEESYFTSLEQITSPDKRLSKWAMQ